MYLDWTIPLIPHNMIILHLPYCHVLNSPFLHSTLVVSFYIDVVLTLSIWLQTGFYHDVIMGVIASQITSLTIVHSMVYSGADHRKHQSSVSLTFVLGIHRWPVNSQHKWPVTRKMFPFDDIIMLRWMAYKHLFMKMSWFFLGPLSQSLSEVGTWICIICFSLMCSVISRPCPDFSGCLAKVLLRVGRWVITSHSFVWMERLIHALEPILVELYVPQDVWPSKWMQTSFFICHFTWK